MKKYFTLMLLGALLISCKTEPAPIAYAATVLIVLISIFLMYTIMGASKLFITKGDELLKDDMTKKEEKNAEDSPLSLQASWETKKPPWVSLKEAFFKKVKAEGINLHSQKSINWSEIRGEEIFLVPQPHQEKQPVFFQIFLFLAQKADKS